MCCELRTRSVPLISAAVNALHRLTLACAVALAWTSRLGTPAPPLHTSPSTLDLLRPPSFVPPSPAITADMHPHSDDTRSHRRPRVPSPFQCSLPLSLPQL